MKLFPSSSKSLLVLNLFLPFMFANLFSVPGKRSNDEGYFFPVDWFEFLIPLKLMQWQYFNIIVGNQSVNSVKNSTWDWRWRIIEDPSFAAMKEYYRADVEMAEMFKLVSSMRNENSLASPFDETYSSNQLHFLCFLEPKEFSLDLMPNFSSQSWLFLTKSTDAEKTVIQWTNVLGDFTNFDSDIFIGIFDSRALKYSVYEIYRLCTSCNVQIHLYCTIHSNNTFEGENCNLDKYQRRKNLEMTKIKAVAVTVNPFDVNVTRTNNSEYELSGGMFAELFTIIMTDVNATYEPVVLEGYKFGKFNPVNKTWDGIMGAVSTGEVDMSISPVSMAADRLAYIDFSTSVHSVAVRIYIHQSVQTKSINWKFYTSPFSPFLHLAVATCCVCLAIALWLFLEARPLKDTEFNLYESSWVILAAFCQKGSHMTPSSPSAKCIFLLAYFTCLIIYCGYSATLTSQLSVPQPLKLPFKDLKGLTTARRWSAGPIKGDFTYIFMQKTCPEILAQNSNHSNTQCELLTQVYNKKVVPVEATLPSNFSEGLRRVLKENFAFITTETGARYIMTTEMKETEACSIYEFKGQPLSSNLGFAMKKNMTFKKLVNYKLLHIFETGTLRRIRQRWLPKLKNCNNVAGDGFTVATLYDVAVAPLIVFVGLIISFVLFIGEFLLARRQEFQPQNSFMYVRTSYPNDFS